MNKQFETFHAEMDKLGFTWESARRQFRHRTRPVIVTDESKHPSRPWCAYVRTRLLCGNGDMIGSGPVRRFASPVTAARAALETL